VAVARIDVAERRRRLGVRHALAPGAHAGDPVEAARRVVGFHGTDPASVFLALRARMPGATVGHLDRELYDARRLLRVLGMRRTLFVVPADLRAAIQSSTLPRVAHAHRRSLLKDLAAAGIEDPGPWLDDVEASTLAALIARGEAGATELVADEPRLATGLRMGAGTAYEAVQNITSRVLILLGARGLIVRGRPGGSWVSRRYSWVPTARWLGQAADPAVAALAAAEPAAEPVFGPLTADPEAAAQGAAELVRRYLGAFGPAPLADLRWWTGWTAAQTKAALAAVSAVEVAVDDGAGAVGPGYVLPDDVEPTADPGPWAALLPALDSTPMGWSARAWYLGGHKGSLFDAMGNIGPSIWLAGRIVGGWAQRPDGEIAVEVLEDVGREARALIDADAAAVAAFLGPARFTPTFRTPLERRLAAPPA